MLSCHLRLGLTLPALLILTGCVGGHRAATTANPETTTGASAATSTSATPGVTTTTWSTFGAALSPTMPVVTTSQLLAATEAFQGKTVVVEGEIVEVCQNKGCWMTFMDGDREMRIRFKDYAFFVPKNCGGKTARIEGVFEMKEVPADEARHYLEDVGKHEEAAAITGPVPSYTFMASGVLLEP